MRVAPERQTSETIEGERKTDTALFADIKGSTELMEELDPEEARPIIDPALKLIFEAVHRYDGYVVQPTGDGIFALFGAPLAHEVQGDFAVGLDGAGGVLGLARQGERLSASNRSAAQLFQDC